MKAEDQILALANWEGWTVHEYGDCGKLGWIPPGGQQYRPGWWRTYYKFSELPNYPTDLNAVHELEKRLTEKQRLDYGNTLIDVCDRDFGKDSHYSKAGTFHIIHATAPQRCEAILRTLGLWVVGTDKPTN